MRKDKGMFKGERRINRQSLTESRWLRVELRGVELPSCCELYAISCEL